MKNLYPLFFPFLRVFAPKVSIVLVFTDFLCEVSDR